EVDRLVGAMEAAHADVHDAWRQRRAVVARHGDERIQPAEGRLRELHGDLRRVLAGHRTTHLRSRVHRRTRTYSFWFDCIMACIPTYCHLGYAFETRRHVAFGAGPARTRRCRRNSPMRSVAFWRG